MTIFLLLLAMTFNANFSSAQEVTPEEFSYAIGINLHENLQKDGISNLDLESVIKGMRDSEAGTSSLTSDEALEKIKSFFKALNEQKAAIAQKEANVFLSENAKRKEVAVTPSGLQYEVLKLGTGAKPLATSTVETHYHGTHLDGSVFDSSVERGQTATFPLNRVIPGWTEGLQLMPVGSKFKFYIPSDLAYGERGSPPTIAPGETLVFEVELISIQE